MVASEVRTLLLSVLLSLVGIFQADWNQKSRLQNLCVSFVLVYPVCRVLEQGWPQHHGLKLALVVPLVIGLCISYADFQQKLTGQKR